MPIHTELDTLVTAVIYTTPCDKFAMPFDNVVANSTMPLGTTILVGWFCIFYYSFEAYRAKNVLLP